MHISQYNTGIPRMWTESGKSGRYLMYGDIYFTDFTCISYTFLFCLLACCCLTDLLPCYLVTLLLCYLFKKVPLTKNRLRAPLVACNCLRDNLLVVELENFNMANVSNDHFFRFTIPPTPLDFSCSWERSLNQNCGLA